MRLFSNSVRQKLKEMNSVTLSSLRQNAGILRAGFMQSPSTSVLRDTSVNYDKVRNIYYNRDASVSNGAFFARSIVDGTADHIGLPNVSMKDDNLDRLVNGWIKNRWQGQMWELYRNAMRDTKVWIRLRRPLPTPFMADDEDNDVILEIVDAEAVVPYYNPATKLLERVEIASTVFIEDAPWNQSMVSSTGARAYGREHKILEIITADQFLYYDQTDGQYLDQFALNNNWGFVPLLEIFNDYDTALDGGICEFETAYPFIQAFHDLIVQTRTSHAYHADPKVKFKLDDVMSFFRNNFPDSIDADGKFTGTVSWKGRDVYFMESAEDVDFIEASLNTNESVNLAEFILDCICIAGEVTESVLFRSQMASAGEANELFRFKKKVERKRNNFSEYLQVMIKMALRISTGKVVRVPELTWDAIQVSDLVTEAQALNQWVTGAEVVNRAGVISKTTYRESARRFFPNMKDDAAEEADVQRDQKQEQDAQVALERRMFDTQASNTNRGVNGASRNGRVKLPLDVISTQPGE